MSYVDLIDETICSLITAPGPAGISVLRVSGPKALYYSKLFCSFIPETPESHRVFFGNFKSPQGEIIDEVLATYFSKGKSFTGDETVEISTHGGFFPSNRVLMELTQAGCRPAARGEFSFRAFYNGKIDLVQAEGILSLIESKSDVGRSLAIRQLKGHLSNTITELEEGLVDVLAQLEAAIDFSTEDIQPSSLADISVQLNNLSGKIETLLQSYRRGKVIHDGINMVIAGPPNAGKSSIYNLVLGQSRAIVTDIPGTTRDLLETTYKDLGLPIQLIDSAGLRESSDVVEKIGIEKTHEALLKSDVIFYVLDIADYANQDLGLLKELRDRVYFVFNKTDLSKDIQSDMKKAYGFVSEQLDIQPDNRMIFLSTKNSSGFQDLKLAIEKESLVNMAVDEALITQYRHFALLSASLEHMKSAYELCVAGGSYDLIALEIQTSLKDVLALLGKEYNEQVLDQVFKKFCLGK